jgi:hypothetical protein
MLAISHLIYLPGPLRGSFIPLISLDGRVHRFITAMPAQISLTLQQPTSNLANHPDRNSGFQEAIVLIVSERLQFSFSSPPFMAR